MKKAVAAILVLAALGGAAVLWGMGGAPPAASGDAAPSVAVATMQLVPGSLPATVAAYGGMAAGAGGEVAVSAGAGGLVTSVPVMQGQAVAAGAVLAVLSADPQSVADLRKAEDAVTAARAGRARAAALLASRLATSADLANADQAARDAAAALAALRASGAGVDRTVTAPFSGVVSAVLAAPGTMQPPGAVLARLIDPARVVAVVGVPPAAAGAVRVGDAVALTLLDAGGGIAGRVAGIAALPDAQTGLTDVTIAPAGPAPVGVPVRAVITTGTLSGYVVPRDAVQNDEQGDYVFQVDARNIAHRVKVRVVGGAGGQSVLAPGLDTSMKLVTVGANQLDDGAAVRIVSPPGAAN